MLQAKLNFTYSLVMSPDEAYGVLDDNGKWTGLIGLLVQDQADMSINDLTITFDRAQVNHYFILTRHNILVVYGHAYHLSIMAWVPLVLSCWKNEHLQSNILCI